MVFAGEGRAPTETMQNHHDHQLAIEVLAVDPWGPGREMLRSVLRRAGWETACAEDGAAAVSLLRARRPQIVVIDEALGLHDDWGILARMRAWSEVACLIVIGVDDDERRMRAFQRGADDYVNKPLSGPELIGRVGARRRMLRRLGAPQHSDVYDDGTVRIHLALRRVEIHGRPLELSPLEYRLLVALVRHRDRALSRDELFELAWHGSPGVGTGDPVKLYVHYLRRKLADHGAQELIQTVRGFGYRWSGAAAAPAAPFVSHTG